ncbi:MAG: hypothetical protein IJ594_00715 [Oscillospiraceae bacterium]|nr:hypothetical protein [Oscillospiraceae bacterium]
METKIMLAAALFFAGWLWSYLFLRQFLFNIVTAFPLIKKMRALREDLIAVGAMRYTTISLITCAVVSVIVLFLILRFCPLYLIISFFVGALLALAMLLNKLSPRNRPMFDTFCAAYCRFVPDDELRTAMFNKKTGQIKSRLKAMEIDGTFIPEFK